VKSSAKTSGYIISWSVNRNR